MDPQQLNELQRFLQYFICVCLGVLSSNCEEAEAREVCRGRGGAVGCHRDLPAAARGFRGAADAGRLEAAASSCGVFVF